MKKKRLDDILIERGLVARKKDAFVVVTEGRVLVERQKAISPAQIVAGDAHIEIRGGDAYVGRGAYKLERAFEKFDIDVRGEICADIGSATGGFTEILLKHGAAKVYAIDTARGKLAFKLREDPRVVVMEGVDARKIESLPDRIDCAVIDVSLISLRAIVPSVRKFLKDDAAIVALFKPQYETRDQSLLRKGIVTDDAAREALLNNFLEWAEKNNWQAVHRIESPIRGDKGNKEYLIYFRI